MIPTKTHKTQVIESAATTLAELKADLTKAGIDYTDCTFFEGLTKIELKNDAAILPHDVPYKGTTTNNLVFMITNASKKIRSGAKLDRKAIIEEIKVKNLAEVVKKTYGKNYTNCKTEDLQKILNKEAASTTADTSAPTAKAAPAKKEAPSKPAMKTTDPSNYVTKAELKKVIESLLKKWRMQVLIILMILILIILLLLVMSLQILQMLQRKRNQILHIHQMNLMICLKTCNL